MAVNINNIYLHPSATAAGAAVSGQSLTVSSAAVSLFGTTAPSINTKFVTVDVQAADCFVTFGGETPSTTIGHRLYAGQNYTWSLHAALVAKFIRASTDSTLYASEWTL